MPRIRWQICLCLALIASGCKQAAKDMAEEAVRGATVQQTANRAIWVLVGLIAVLGILGVASSLGLLVLALVIWRSRPRSAA